MDSKHSRGNVLNKPSSQRHDVGVAGSDEIELKDRAVEVTAAEKRCKASLACHDVGPGLVNADFQHRLIGFQGRVVKLGAVARGERV